MKWQAAPDIQREVKRIIKELDFAHLNPQRIFCFRSFGSTSRARARIWSLPRIWQEALRAEPAYCLEVLAEKFDKLKEEDQQRILIHELLHIPKNFSGSLLSHRRLGGLSFARRVEILFQKLQ